MGEAVPTALFPPRPFWSHRARMRDSDLYAQIFGITYAWHVSYLQLDVPGGKVAEVPRVVCPEHALVHAATPWSEAVRASRRSWSSW